MSRLHKINRGFWDSANCCLLCRLIDSFSIGQLIIYIAWWGGACKGVFIVSEMSDRDIDRIYFDELRAQVLIAKHCVEGGKFSECVHRKHAHT